MTFKFTFGLAGLVEELEYRDEESRNNPAPTLLGRIRPRSNGQGKDIYA